MREAAAYRIVADRDLRLCGRELGRCMNALREWEATPEQADAALEAYKAENDRLRASVQDAMASAIAAQERQQRLKGWATVGKVSVGLLGLGVGLFTYQQLQP